MIQFYFLSILCNSLIGYILFVYDGAGEENVDKGFNTGVLSINNPTFHLVLGILSIISGVLKLLSPAMDNIPILGDLLPAVAGVIAGFVLIFGVYRRQSTASVDKDSRMDRLGENLLRYRKFLGAALLVTALLHFLFPQALFL
ncbi:MAG: hypothetical protein FWG99_04315 [Treponema sp.]|nr:hypothetical protein [Treponema sp.]